MATITIASQFPRTTLTIRILSKHVQTSYHATSINVGTADHSLCWRPLKLCSSSTRGLTCFSKPISSVGSGLAATVPKDNAITLKDPKIVVEYQDDDKIQLRVDLTGNETQKVFDLVLTNLASSAPPVPGFRRQKGGKTSTVPKNIQLEFLGKGRVTKFVIQEIVNITMSDYKKENPNAKIKKISTVQTEDELTSLFSPGNEFGFNATVELESLEPENSTSS